jgi:hypothetical protein
MSGDTAVKHDIIEMRCQVFLMEDIRTISKIYHIKCHFSE